MLRNYSLKGIITLTPRVSEVNIFGLGAAVSRAIKLAMLLQLKFDPSLQFDMRTSTVPLLDEYHARHEVRAKL